ncbi:hypothetical protein ACWAUC_19730 [Bradyrhizobium guangdongense]
MTDKPAKPRGISKKIMAAIDAMVHGDAKTVTDAAVVAGISREHLSRELGKPHIARALHDKASRNISIAAAKASATKVSLLDSSNELVRDRASSFILGVAGISPENAPAAPGGRAMLPGLQIVIHTSDGGARLVAGPSGLQEPRLLEHEPILEAANVDE